MTTCYITLSAGTSNVMTTSLTTMQIFMETNLEIDKISFKRLYDKQNLTLVTIHIKIIKLAKGLFNKFHMK